MKKVYFPQYGGISTEQNLVQDLVDEQIKLFGSDVFYIPRTMLRDKTLGEVVHSEFNQAYMVEMLLVNVEGFGAPSEFISQFGVRVTDEIKFVLSKRRWEQSLVPTLSLNITDRPNEGDLIYFPLTENAYEIKFVERETPFYQLGKLYYYEITAEIYEQGADEFDTGIEEIDEIELDNAVVTTLTLSVQRSTATATSTLTTGGVVSSINLTSGGSGYKTAPTVTLSAPPTGGSQATATCTIDNGVVNAIQITDLGSGYTTPPTVTFDAPSLPVDFLAREYVVSGNFSDRGGDRTWAADGSGLVFIDHSASFDPTYATTTQSKYFFWSFEDNRLKYRYTYNGTTATTTKGYFYYDAANNRYVLNAYEATDTSGNRAQMYDLSSSVIGEVASWNGSKFQLGLMNKTGDFRDGDLIRGTTSNALYTLGAFSSIDNLNSEYDQNLSIEDGGDDIVDWTEGNPFGEYGNFTGSF